MRKVYVDNAATSYPKPKEVGTEMIRYIEEIGGNAGRGTHESSYTAGRVIYETRELLCDLFHFNSSVNVAFTMNITQSLNTILKGLLKAGDHVLITSMEHNAVVRPLTSLSERGVEFTKVPCEKDGTLRVERLEKAIKENTKLVVMTHASNVCGTILPVMEVGRICKERGIYFILDSAQSAGVLEVDFEKFNLNALAFTGHKGLLGPQGIGGFIVDSKLAEEIHPFIEGGTGSFSESEQQPICMPDKFESGTLNIPGIFGLNAGIKFLNKVGLKEIYAHEQQLSQLFLKEIANMEGIYVAGMPSEMGRTSVFSLDFQKKDNAEVGFILDREFGVMTRVGLHCSPLAHKTLGTFPQGSVRFSFGYFNAKEEIQYVIDSIHKTLKLV